MSKRNLEDFPLESENKKFKLKAFPVGKVHIGSMILRGPHASIPSGFKRVNVTSAQRKNNPHRLAFSPMTPREKRYKGYWNFEAYWQSGKVYPGIDRIKQLLWWKKVGHNGKPKRRYPNSKNKKVEYSQWNGGKKMNYIESRKEVYVPEYYNLIKDEKALESLKNYHKRGGNIIIYDFDGPFDGKVPIIEKVNKELLIKKINDPSRSFGHGYVVAGAILGIEPSKYTM